MSEKIEAAPEWLEHLSVLRLEPGDIIVLRSPRMLQLDAVKRLSAEAQARFPDNKVLVLMDGVDIGVVRPVD